MLPHFFGDETARSRHGVFVFSLVSVRGWDNSSLVMVRSPSYFKTRPLTVAVHPPGTSQESARRLADEVAGQRPASADLPSEPQLEPHPGTFTVSKVQPGSLAFFGHLCKKL